MILRAMALGLGLPSEDFFLRFHSGHNNQLRLLHYPAVPTARLESEVFTRLDAHTDWPSITMVFQDDCGGLQVLFPRFFLFFLLLFYSSPLILSHWGLPFLLPPSLPPLPLYIYIKYILSPHQKNPPKKHKMSQSINQLNKKKMIKLTPYFPQFSQFADRKPT